MKDFIKWYGSKLDLDQPVYVYVPLAFILIASLFLLLLVGIFAMIATHGVPLVLIPLGLYVWYVEDTKDKTDD